MVHAIVVPADDALALFKLELNDINDYQKVVGGLFEVLDLTNPDASIWSNEEGLILDLPKNRRASILLWMGNENHRNYTTLRGDCFITGQPDDEGDTTDVPGELAHLLLEVQRFKFEVQTFDDKTAWNSNAQRFDDPFQACIAALMLADKWMSVQQVRLASA